MITPAVIPISLNRDISNSGPISPIDVSALLVQSIHVNSASNNKGKSVEHEPTVKEKPNSLGEIEKYVVPFVVGLGGFGGTLGSVDQVFGSGSFGIKLLVAFILAVLFAPLLRLVFYTVGLILLRRVSLAVAVPAFVGALALYSAMMGVALWFVQTGWHRFIR